MGFLDGFTDKDERTGTYKHHLYHQDVAELCGTLGELRQWLDEMVARHGEGAKLEVPHSCEDCGSSVSYSLERPATPEEVAKYEAEQARKRAETEERERRQFEELRAKFEGGK